MSTRAQRTGSYLAADPREPLVELTIGDLLRANAAANPDRLALVDGTADRSARRSWTYAQLLAEATEVASALLARCAPGDRVAVWTPNRVEWVLLQLGCALAGLILVPVNPAHRAAELSYVLRHSLARAIFHDSGYRGFDMAEAVAHQLPRLPDLHHAVCLDDWDEFRRGGGGARPLPAVTPGDPLQLQYTSGTTGDPKGAVLHHRGVVNASRLVARGSAFPSGGVWVNAMPLFHIGGALTEVGAFAQGGTYVLAPGFDAALLLELIETYRANITLLVPTMLHAVLAHPDCDLRDLSSLRTVMCGAAPVPADLVPRAKSTLDCDLTIVFGQTELHGVISQTRPEDTPEDQAGTIGRPLPQVEVKIADPAGGAVVPLGEPGEICARGYQTMLGYFEGPERFSAALDGEGWLHTGDVGEMDERGYLTITGRLRDMIIRGGENVYPREVENVLQAHPDVAEAVVVGVPDDYWGERVAAVLRPADPRSRPAPRQLLRYCLARLAGYKTPSVWYFTDALPITATGKLQRYVLRSQIADGTLAPAATTDQLDPISP